MPELPEIETIRRGIAPHLRGRAFTDCRVRESRLRWPVPAGLRERIHGQVVRDIRRRGKYLLLGLDEGGLVLHLGMSGSLRVVTAETRPRAHDHVDLVLDDGNCLRLRDPRRFGALLWSAGDPAGHPLLARLGPEPLGPALDGAYLYNRARGRRLAVKPFLMDGHVVVGVGNIYANEALYLAGIHPGRPSGHVSERRYGVLARAVKEVLAAAIEAGGTTLRDFVDEAGRPGYFRQRLGVYDREGLPCVACGGPIQRRVIGQRASYYCPRCQT